MLRITYRMGLFGAAVFALLLALLLFQTLSGSAERGRIPDENKVSGSQNITSSLIVEPLSDLLTPEDLAMMLVGDGITISNVIYTGVNIASGSFYEGDGVVGFERGILLTSGSVYNVVGPNSSDGITGNNGMPGDPDLSILSGFQTFDASILEFEFIPQEDTVFFRYVFASDEYNEFVNTPYNDVFAFFINGENCARVEGSHVSINQINYGNPYGTAPYSHPEYYINNDLSEGGGAIDTELDGLTVGLTCWANVNPGQVNTMKLAIADASDFVLDSAVFIEASSLTSATVIELMGLEVTQAIQNWQHDVTPLVQDKPAFLRAHMRSVSGTVYNVKARLIGTRNGDPLPGSPLAPSNLGGNIDVLQYPSRTARNDSLYFEIPPLWLNGTVEFEVVGVGQTIDCKDHANIHDDCKVQVTFQAGGEPEVRMVGIVWNDSQGGVHDPFLGDYWAVVQDIEAEYPTANLNWNNPYELTYVMDGPPPLWLVNLRLGQQRLLDGCISGWPFHCNRIYFGLLIDNQGGDLGLATLDGVVSSGYYRQEDPTTPAHEIAHNLGRRHTACQGNEADPDPDYPYSNGRISPSLTGDQAIYYGFHTRTLQIFSPQTGDLMGYCRPRWVSDYTYQRLWTAINSRFPANLAATSQALALSAAETAVLVSGHIDQQNGSGTFDSVIQFNTSATPPAPEPGHLAVAFMDQNGAHLARYDFAPDYPADQSESMGIFNLLLPWPEGVQTIVLLEGETVLDSRSASDHAPQVELIQPNSGETWSGSTAVIAWTGSDPDRDELDYTVQYSPDAGQTWLTLTTVWQEESYLVDLETLPGSDTARVRVLASDGFHTYQVLSDGLFVVETRAPVVAITSPEADRIYVEDQTLVFRGSAYDPEDGHLDDTSLQWISNLTGHLGEGRTLAINALSLPAGNHIITLVAEDSHGKVGTANTSVQIFRFRPTLPKILEVTPGLAVFSAIEGENTVFTLDVAVRNEGDGTIVWDASTDQEWLLASQETGFTPANLVVEIDTTGLAPGVYTGALTISDQEGLNLPQTVEFELSIYQAVSSAFSASPTTGIAPFEVSFKNLSSGHFNTCFWNFGDGSTDLDCNDPTHTYIQAGVYTVTLTVSGLGGTSDYSIPNPITIYQQAVAAFSASPNTGSAPLQVTFTNQSTGDYETCTWDFGDGIYHTDCADRTYTYTRTGKYTVALTITGLGGEAVLALEDYISVGGGLYLPLITFH
jgi:PKD repeat protein